MADVKNLSQKFRLDTYLSFDIRYADDITMHMVFEKLQLTNEDLQFACM